jgi:predicted permease
MGRESGLSSKEKNNKGRKNMKKRILISAICLIFLASTAIAEEIRSVRIGQNLRMVVIFSNMEGLHMQYFTEPRAGEGPKFLGEEIFKNGEKTFDNYREND